MCGIAGYAGYQAIDAANVDNCLRRMRRRGPDHADYFRHISPDGRHVYLLNSRLSIIDLDQRSHQPFRIGSKVLVYNGELYNYLELRNELRSRGYEFLTESDTEVLLRTFMEFGLEEGLDRCDGMWAFAVFDEAENVLWLGRD